MASAALKHCARSCLCINKYLMITSTQAATKCCKQFLCQQNFSLSRLDYSSSAEAAKTNVKRIPDSDPKNLDTGKCSHSNQCPEENGRIRENSSAAKLVQHSDPDTFGSVNVQKTGQLTFDKLLDDLPKEEGDKIEQTYVDAATRRKRLKLKEYAAIIRKLIKDKKVKDAIDVLEVRMLKEDKAKPDYYIYNLLISGCGHIGYTKKAFQLFNNMKKRGLRPTSASYTALFNSCANCPFPEFGLKQAKHLKSLMEEKSIFIEPITYHAMIKAFGRCGATDVAFSLVDEMVEKKLALSSDTFNFLLQACISDKEAGFRHALLVWHKLRRKWLIPTVYTYNLLLRTVRECGTGDHTAFQQAINQIILGGVFSPAEHKLRITEESPTKTENLCNQRNGETSSLTAELSRQSDSSDAVTTLPPVFDLETCPNLQVIEDRPNLLAYKGHLGSIVVLEEIKTPQDRLILLGGINGVLKEMETDGVKPTVSTFNLLLDIIPDTISAEKALLSIMKKHNVAPNLHFFNILIKKRAMRFDYESARDVLTLLQMHQLEPDIMTFGVLALSCKRKAEAENLLKSMSAAGFYPNIETLGAMMRQACRHYSFGYIVYLMKYVEKEEIEPNKLFLKHLKDFYDNCINSFKKLHKKEDTNIPDFFSSTTFQEGFTLFQKFYKYWLGNVKVEPELHPWAEVNKVI